MRKFKNILLAFPALILIVLIVIVPVIATAFYSFTDWSGFSNVFTFVGFSNYQNILTEGEFWLAFLNNVKWTIFFITVPVALSLIAAVSMDNVPSKAKSFFKMLFFMPYILPTVVVARIWQTLFFDPHYGIIHSIPLLDSIHYLDSTSMALWTVAIINLWAWWGFLAVVFSAAIDQVDRTYYEAAQVEGANRWQTFLYVTLPMIFPTALFMEIMTVIWSFLVFDWIYIITTGGPGGASEVLSTLSYKTAFFDFNFGKSTAIAFMMTLFAAVPIGLYLFLLNRREVEA